MSYRVLRYLPIRSFPPGEFSPIALDPHGSRQKGTSSCSTTRNVSQIGKGHGCSMRHSHSLPKDLALNGSIVTVVPTRSSSSSFRSTLASIGPPAIAIVRASPNDASLDICRCRIPRSHTYFSPFFPRTQLLGTHAACCVPLTVTNIPRRDSPCLPWLEPRDRNVNHILRGNSTRQ